MYTAIGNRIRRIRKQQGITQEKLAEAVGISTSFIGHIERGTRKLSVDTLYKIAKTLNCSADELLGIDFPAHTSAIADELANIISDLQALKRRFK